MRESLLPLIRARSEALDKPLAPMATWLAAGRSGSIGAPTKLPDRHVVFERGEPADTAYLLMKGAIEIVQRNADGNALVVKILVAPTLFGVIELVSDEQTYLETTKVLGGATMVAMNLPQFRNTLDSDNRLAFECLSDVARAFCVTARFEGAVLEPTEVLLANLLLAYADVFGVPDTEGGVRIELKRSQADFAQGIGAGERSVNRVLSRFIDDRLIDKVRARYVLRQLEPLRALAGDRLGSLVHRAGPTQAGPARSR
jgi:CRP-like cAMP-binding protein